MTSIKTVAAMIRDAEQHADDTAKDRTLADEYYRGVMSDLPADQHRSQAMSRDVRVHIKRALPSIMRTIFGSDDVVEFLPMGEGDEEAARQASDFINYVVFPETDGRKAVYDAIHDALLHRNGILRWWHDERRCASFSSHTGLSQQELDVLAGDDGAEVVEATERMEAIDAPDGSGQIEIPVFDVKIKRIITKREYKISAVPRERFLIHSEATSIEDSLLTGERTPMRRSDLVAMGYDRDMVMSLQLSGDDDDEQDARRDNARDAQESDPANDEIDYFEVFVRVDMDGDGIAELRRMCFAGALTEDNLLVDEECDEIQFTDLTAMQQPHQWEGISLFDDLKDIQQVKTALRRQTLDNIYWQNNMQPIVQMGRVQNPDAVMNPQFGQPIVLKDGGSARDAIQWNPVPFVGAQSFAMMEYIDQEGQDRTGISDASAGLAPDALQNMTAKASAMIEQAGIGQVEMMVRTIAEGLRRFYRGLLRLVIRHQDKPRTVRLRKQWVQFDPRHWNAEMDATVNVGLGAGTRERDMQVMQFVMNLQEKLLAAFGPDNPYVKPDQLYNALAKTVESAGLKTPSLFFTEPDMQEVAQKMQAAQNQPNPEAERLKGEMQLKQADMQMKMQLEQAKMQASQAKEKAQMEADLMVRQKEIEASSIAQREKLQSDAALQEQRLAFEREKLAADVQLQREKMQQELADAFAKAQADMARNGVQNARTV